MAQAGTETELIAPRQMERLSVALVATEDRVDSKAEGTSVSLVVEPQSCHRVVQSSSMWRVINVGWMKGRRETITTTHEQYMKDM